MISKGLVNEKNSRKIQEMDGGFCVVNPRSGLYIKA